MSHFGQLVLLGLLLATALPARAEFDEVEFARTLVRARHIEGLPYARARELTPAGVEILTEMLEDPAETEYRDNIVMALGMSGHPQAYLALTRFRERLVGGEVDSAEYRARRALPFAMGHLARSDERAFQFLVESVRGEARKSAPDWSYRHLAGQRLEGILRRAAIMGVAISGRPEAVAALHELGERARREPSTTEELRTHIQDAQAVCDRVMLEGPDQIFGNGAAR
jgi:hypothetical protein